jgi:hypothetical protein
VGRIHKFLMILVLAVSFSANALKTKQEQIVAMEAILAELNTHYGMAKYKAKTFGVTTATLREKYTRLIEDATTLEEEHNFDLPVPHNILEPEDFRQLMIGMITELRDGHVNLNRQDSEAASLGLNASPLGEKLIVTAIREPYMAKDSSTTEIKVGDEILELDGVPVTEIGKRNMLYSQGGTHWDRWHRAMSTVVTRFAAFQKLPKEGQVVNVKLNRGGQEFYARLKWVYVSEYQKLAAQFPNDSKNPFKTMFSEEVPVPYGFTGTVSSYFRQGLLNLPDFSANIVDIGDAVNRDIEKKKITNLQPVTRLPVYMIRVGSVNVGVLRLPSYSPQGDKMAGIAQEYLWLTEAMRRLERLTDVLIIDQLSNSGGSVYYTARLLGLFNNKAEPMKTVKADTKLNKTLLKNWDPTPWADPIYGTLPNYSEMKLSKKAHDELKLKFESGEEWSGFMPSFDIASSGDVDETGQVFSAKEGVYTKPILILNDHLSGSGGDFFPAQMQQNNRATVMGETSCGLGGPVYRGIDSMPGSELSMRCTVAYAQLDNGWPIENIGVVPDYYRTIEPIDISNQFSHYSAEVLTKALELVGGPKAESLIQSQAPNPSASGAKILKVAAEMIGLEADAYAKQVTKLSQLIEKGSDQDWQDVVIPLPESLLQDPILRTLWQRLEVIERLKDMLRLPQWQQQQSLIKALIALAERLPADVKFANPCELRLRMGPINLGL